MGVSLRCARRQDGKTDSVADGVTLRDDAWDTR